jgi:hypothetical protein
MNYRVNDSLSRGYYESYIYITAEDGIRTLLRHDGLKQGMEALKVILLGNH